MMMMSAEDEERKVAKGTDDHEVLRWQEKKKLVDKERQALEAELEDLITWINEIENMDGQQLKEYLKNRPENLKTLTTEKSTPNKRVPRARKSKNSGIMSTVWKFHRKDGDPGSSSSIKENA